MLHLIDANVLISSANGLFQIDRVPQFWDWLVLMGERGRVAIPVEIWDEVREGDDLLAQWARSAPVKESLLLPDDPDPATVSRCLNQGYAPDLTDSELEEVGRDPFLIAYALTAPSTRCVVTNEVSRPGKKRGRRMIPDVCRTFEITCIDTVGLINSLDFRIL